MCVVSMSSKSDTEHSSLPAWQGLRYDPANSAYTDMFTSVTWSAFLCRSPLVLAAALVLSTPVCADTYNTEKECLRDLEAAKTRVQNWYHRKEGERLDKPSDLDFELELQFAENKELCSVGYIGQFGLHGQWPDGKDAYSKDVLERLKEWTKLQLQKTLPDFPVFGSQSEEPPSFAEWRRKQVKETGEMLRGAVFRCYSWIAGEAKGGGIKTAIRAHHLECKANGWRSERLSLVTDEDFEAQFKSVMESLLDSFANRYDQLKRR